MHIQQCGIALNSSGKHSLDLRMERIVSLENFYRNSIRCIVYHGLEIYAMGASIHSHKNGFRAIILIVG